jgi:hypothetical protein
MTAYFTRERFGRSQLYAGLLLLAFLAQALWLVHKEIPGGSFPESPEALRIGEGWKQWHGHGLAAAPLLDPSEDAMQVIVHTDDRGFDVERSPLLYLVSAAPLLIWPHDLTPDTVRYWRWLPRLPFLAIGVFLGASLWYVARRLCGNTGGFVALTFYCFSPSLIQSSALWHTDPHIVAAWGAFGAIFTAIAVAHTLYAPREVVLWNWRRIVLLGIALAIAIGSQFSMIVLVPVTLAFLLYVAPVRKRAGLVIWVASCGIAFVFLFAMYFFHLHAFGQSLANAEFWGATWRGFTFLNVYKQIGVQIYRACPVLVLALPVTLITYAVWPRTRYFGNTAPLLMVLLLVVLTIAHPEVSHSGFLPAAMPFLFVFVAGVLADLIETTYRTLVLGCVALILTMYVAVTLIALGRVPQG